jgi:hypothetical protein
MLEGDLEGLGNGDCGHGWSSGLAEGIEHRAGSGVYAPRMLAIASFTLAALFVSRLLASSVPALVPVRIRRSPRAFRP